MEENVKVFKRTFTQAMLENFPQYLGKEFICVRKWEDIEILFPWVWTGYVCENCGYKKNTQINHIVKRIEVYKPEIILEEDPSKSPEIWLAFTKDDKIMKIPENKIAEFVMKANTRSQ